MSSMLSVYNIVDMKHAPAFKVLEIFRDFILIYKVEDREAHIHKVRDVAEKVLLKIDELFREGKASPTDVTADNRTLLFYFMRYVR